MTTLQPSTDSQSRSGMLLNELRGRVIGVLAIFSLFTSIIGVFATIASDAFDARGLITTTIFVVTALITLVLIRLKQIQLAAILLILLYTASTLLIPMGYILLASLTLIAAATLATTPLYILANVVVLSYQVIQIVNDFNVAQASGDFPSFDAVTLLLTFIIISLATRYFIYQAERATQSARSSANLLQAVAETGEILAKMLNLNELLPRAVEMVRERFAFYHVQVFLLDEAGEYATLAASTGALGQKLMERRHRLAVGSQSVIGTVTARKEAVVARDTDPIYYRNELLPNTRSELAVPITDGDRIIGALDVQSRRPDAFDTEAVQAMQVMANLLGTSIRNARLFEQQTRSARETKRLFLEAETNLREIQRLNQQLTHQGWENYFQTRQDVRGVTLGEEQFLPESDWSDALVKASQTRQPVVVDEAGSGPIIAVPVMLGNEVIGAIEVEAGSEEQEAETLEMVKAVAQRLALSLDKARLFEESQEATAQEQRINQIAARYQTVTNVDELLKITLAELSDTLGARRGAIRLGSLQPEANGNGSTAHD